jgi:hypothetical protein
MTQTTAKNAAPGSSVERVFTLFPKLPPELAVRIWKYAAQGVESCFIVFRRKSNIVPKVFHAWHLSRWIAMRGYQFRKYRKDHGRQWIHYTYQLCPASCLYYTRLKTGSDSLRFHWLVQTCETTCNQCRRIFCSCLSLQWLSSLLVEVCGL